ncbi:MAG TPA: TetR/AcrR family transcriptional regulator [Acidimicrobiales bacterium]|nr:TetR/AcrR family transcriptional regulator [Acidimicrobiales bacterium]
MTAGADTRVQRRTGQARRQQILDAAVELFAAEGYRGTGMAALAERVGMTAPGLLYYFGSRERLLAEVVAERDRVDLSALPAEVSLRDLRDMGQHNVETGLLTRLFAVLTTENLDPDKPLHEFFARRYDETRTFFRSILEREQADGSIRPDVDVEQIANEMVSTALGAEIQWLLDPDHFDLGEMFRRYVDRLAEDLAAPDKSRRTSAPGGEPIRQESS